ncbi:putative AAA- family ATPase [Cotonvirus japonicus]|uniref:AAA- family ATPase n=1 Tax=Cotonvirus japonicus TaxID=2811091 RepID=A0ABM7NU42_9VIRU|nr:putative AAA- family ATPase [Cotonvirus japonicus]BCS83685.1 putative AAA- family ATPase [Cotonvirus japonicus]
MLRLAYKINYHIIDNISNNMIKTTLVTSTVAFATYKFSDKFYEIIKDFITNNFLGKLEINTKVNPKLTHAIMAELENILEKSKLVKVSDGNFGVRYELKYGTYMIDTKKYGKIIIKYNENLIVLYNFPKFTLFPPCIKKQTHKLKAFVDDIYKKYCSPNVMRMCYTADKDSWSFPIIRRPSNFPKENLTTDMKHLLSDVDKFMSSEKIYTDRGINYRRGYLIHGESGCGKTGMISIIANKYNMDIYTLNINSQNMSDTMLINLVSNVKPNSILAIEEIDKQIETLQANGNRHVSIGGILSALDGPQGLAHRVIVIMTSNCNDFLNPKYMEPLIRPGRIDKCVEFKTKIHLNLDDVFDDSC